MINIPVHDFTVRINDLWDNRWFLLTCGDFERKQFNTMTISWGFFGIMWNKPVAVVVVRPSRFTFDFINQFDTFTLSSFGNKYHKDLQLLGTKSGRNGDKISETDLTVIPAQKVASPAFREAELIIECRKIYWDDFKPDHFLVPSIGKVYPKKDYHRMFFGEILNISGKKKFHSEK